MDRKDEIAIFLREFIGNSVYANSCTIKNMDDINLFYSKKTGVLTASADKPLIIENKKLGYTITYFLDNFSRTYKNVQYAGNYIFNEVPAATPKAREKIIANREDAYVGSRMQFIRALWHETIDKTGFRLYNGSIQPLSERDIVKHDSLQQKYIVLENRVFVYHRSDMRHPNSIASKMPYSFIDGDGYYGAGLQWGGPMGNQRIGDLLPFEYHSASDFEKYVPKSITDTSAAKNAAAINAPNKGKADSKDVKLFKSLVLVTDDPIAGIPVVRKWAQPVNYKIYGSCGNEAYDQTIAGYVSGLFKLITEYAGLQIKEAGVGDAVNFYILMGEPGKYKNIIGADALNYFNTNKALHNTEKSTGYYHWSANGFTDMIQLVDVNAIGQNKAIWNQVKIQLMNGLGFFGSTSKNSESIFYSGVNDWVPEKGIEAFDQHMIKTLYQPAVRSGMTEHELDIALTNKPL